MSGFDLVKGVFRRATQTVREKVGNAEGSGDPVLQDATGKIHMMEKTSATLSEKIMKLSKAFEDVGSLMHEIGEEYKRFSQEAGNAASPEIATLSSELSAFGQEFNNKAQETGRQLKESGFDVMGAFTREIHSLKNYEEDRRKKQLEFDFFNTKTNELMKNPPKDAHDRIPRNESIRENWRVQLHGANEAMKVACSNIFLQGQKALDMTVYTTCISTGNLLNYGLNSVKVHFANARLPVYRTEPLLVPTQLAPPPARWVPPQPAPYQPFPAQQTGQSPQQQQGQYGAPQQQQSPYGQPGQPPQQQQQQSPQSWNQQAPPQQQQQQQNWNQQQPPQQQQQQQQNWNQQQQSPPQQHGTSPSQQNVAPPNASFNNQPPNASFNNQPPPQQNWNQQPQQAQSAPAPAQQQQQHVASASSSPQQQQQQAQPPANNFNPFEPAKPSGASSNAGSQAPYVPPPKPDDGSEPPPLN